jgi:dipeptidyl aminopeptidase/acylaminoacyl peptidase
LIQQGAKDDSTPIEWGRATYQKLVEQKKDVQIIEYPYEGHEFATSFNSFMQSSLDFFNSHLL